MARCGAFLFVLWLTAMHFAGLYLFTRGFLLTRLSLPDVGACALDGVISMDERDRATPAAAGCTRAKAYDRVVLLVVDALRFDFVAHDASFDGRKDVPHYINKMPNVSRLVGAPSIPGGVTHAKLFRFAADAPTTTMQRIKALMTGSLPTFIDAGSNFAAAAVGEDNLLAHLNRRAVFVGDDTWAEMFPSSFLRAHPYPSFDVHDLHTVDAGVEKHIFSELAAVGEWDVAVAHMLGVDHCGHRYGPNHPAMAAKLAQVDALVARVHAHMGERDLLLVLGDHGMTPDGDHGGDSPLETHAALVAISKRGFASAGGLLDTIASAEDYDAVGGPPQTGERVRSVAQIDLVPTLAAVLGVPIPFGNIGAAVLPELLSTASAHEAEALSASVDWLGVNALQVERYAHTYAAAAGWSDGAAQSRDPELARATELHAAAAAAPPGSESRERNAREAAASYIRYVRSVRRRFVEAWAMFSVPSMAMGIAVLALSVACAGVCASWMAVVGLSLPSRTHALTGAALGFAVAAVVQALAMALTGQLSGPLVAVASDFARGCSLLALFVCPFASALLPIVRSSASPDRNGIMDLVRGVAGLLSIRAAPISTSLAAACCAMVAVRAVGFASNSFVVADDSVAHFLAMSAIVAHAAFLICAAAEDVSSSPSARGDAVAVARTLRPRLRVVLLLFFGIAVCLRVLPLFWMCREEQHRCLVARDGGRASSSSSKPSADALSSSGTWFGDLSVHTALAAVLLFAPKWPSSASMNVGGPFGRFYGAFPWAAMAAILAYWTHASLPVAGGTPGWIRLIYPRALYAMAFVGAVLLFAFPSTAVEDNSASVAAQQPGRAVVHGLRTVFSSAALGAAGLLVPVVVLLMGRDRVLPTAIVWVCAALVRIAAAPLGEVAFYMASQRRIGELSAALRASEGASVGANGKPVAGKRGHGSPSTPGVGETATIAASAADAIPVEAFDVDRRQSASASVVVLAVLVASCAFYATGHQPALAAIRWSAAFEGFAGSDGSRVGPAILVLVDTFWPQLLVALASPLLSLIAETTIGDANPSDGEGEYRIARERSEGREGPFWAAAVRAPVVACACHAVWVAGSAVAGLLHRRHLMVWKIFAPNFVFSALALVVVDVGALLAVALMELCDGAARRWVASIAGRIGGAQSQPRVLSAPK